MAEYTSRMWVTVFGQKRYTDKKMAKHTSSEWVPLQYLCRSESEVMELDHWEEQHTLFFFVSLILCILLIDFSSGPFLGNLSKSLLFGIQWFWPIFSYKFNKSLFWMAGIISNLFYWSADSLFAFLKFILSIIIPTALLICMENTFWTIGRDGNFVELFKKSFTSYESGMRKETEAEIDLLLTRWQRNERGYSLATDHYFKKEFSTFIIEHCLRKFHFYLLLTSPLTIFCGWSFWAGTKK